MLFEKGVVAISFFQENSLTLLLTLATLGTFAWLLLCRERLRITWIAALVLSLLHVAVGLLCVKFFAFLEGADSGARSLFGAVFFMPLAYLLGAKLGRRKTADVFDIFAVCMIFTLFCARISCLITGCCQGRMIPGLEPLRWPTREAELVFYVLFLSLTAPKVWMRKTFGQVYPQYMMCYGLLRFVLELFRDNGSNYIFHLAHIWALLSLILGFVIASELKRRHSVPPARKREMR